MMSNKYNNKYRIPSARLRMWDYGNDGSYFITICTKNRERYFGEIVHGTDEPEMELNEIGKLAEFFWIEIPKHFPFIKLGNFVVMPNHVHGILCIDKSVNCTNIIDSSILSVATTTKTGLIDEVGMRLIDDVETRLIDDVETRLIDDVETRLIASLPFVDNSQSVTVEKPQSEIRITLQPKTPIINPPKEKGGFAGDKNPMLQDNISRICRWYKGRCSFEMRKIHANFEWQPRFHDHIIRNLESLERIQNYIANNPKNWKEDKFYK